MAGEAAGQGERRGKAAGGGERQDVVTHRRACSQAAPEGEEEGFCACTVARGVDGVVNKNLFPHPMASTPSLDIRGEADTDCPMHQISTPRAQLDWAARHHASCLTLRVLLAEIWTS